MTHYSYAIHDAIAATGLPTVEVHISNVRAREQWRRHSVIAPACVYTIFGRGVDGYRFAIDHLINRSKTAFRTFSYGRAVDQVGDLRVPDGTGPHPVAVLLHGGFWREHWTRDIMENIAVDLTEHGWATWNLEYHRVGNGGGWTSTLEDVATGIDHLEDLAAEHNLDSSRVVTVGHSAGGHLALWAAARPRLTASGPQPASRVPVVAAVALAPVSDLITGFEENLGEGAVESFLRRTPLDGADRYAAASPRELLPLRIPQLIVHGTDDADVPVAMSRSYAAAATAAGDRVTFHELDGGDHMSVVDPRHPAWELTLSELNQLL